MLLWGEAMNRMAVTNTRDIRKIFKMCAKSAWMDLREQARRSDIDPGRMGIAIF
jgi:hypothetical protein